MLNEIFIKNYLLVREQRLSFGPGMTVLSGETGAGKSILVGSVALIFGDSAPALEPYTPGEPIYLEASFDISSNSEVRQYLEEQGYEPEGDLCLAREINPGGRSAYFLNGRKVAASFLKELKPLMIDFHHQRDQQRLLSNAYQLQLLDLYAKNQELKDAFATRFRGLKAALKELEALKAEEENIRQLTELYRYQFEELEKAVLREGEDLELQQEFDLLSHAQEIGETAAESAYVLYESEDSVHSRLNHCLAGLSRYSGLNPRISSAEQNLRECLEIVSDSASELGALSQDINADPQRLEEIRERLDLINGLLHKHQAQNISSLLELFAQREAQITAFEDLSAKINSLELQIQNNFESLKETGNKLSLSRQKASDKLSRELQENIRMLSIPDARCKISIDKKAEGKIILMEYLDSCSEQGQDGCQFFFSANRGSELGPLSAVASGGELSRILLAIKKVLSDRIEEKLMILDEIDSGIGGKTAEHVAQFIFQLSRRHRILCITHLAQIAAIAHQQVALHKETGKSKNLIRMVPLEPRERLLELARMLAGDVSEISVQHAEELINKYKT
jgi:DNA repair protein RecN (Recombination protein N)